MKRILITGGAGFIGSHLATHFIKKYPDYHIIVVDKLTYASNPNNIEGPHTLIKSDITKYSTILKIFNTYRITDVIHLAAESHVDNSIENPDEFIQTNIN